MSYRARLRNDPQSPSRCVEARRRVLLLQDQAPWPICSDHPTRLTLSQQAAQLPWSDRWPVRSGCMRSFRRFARSRAESPRSTLPRRITKLTKISVNSSFWSFPALTPTSFHTEDLNSLVRSYELDESPRPVTRMALGTELLSSARSRKTSAKDLRLACILRRQLQKPPDRLFSGGPIRLHPGRPEESSQPWYFRICQC